MTGREKFLIKTAAVLTVVLTVGVVVDPRFPSGTGGSMEPFLRDGQRCIFTRPWRTIREGDIVLFDDPLSEALAVKRVLRREGGAFWVQSEADDVAAGTVDSDQFGWLDQQAVRGLLVARLPALFDGEKTSDPSPSSEKEFSTEERLESISNRLTYNAGRVRAIGDALRVNRVATSIPVPLERSIFLSGGEKVEIEISAEKPFKTLILWDFSAEYSEVEVLLPSGDRLSCPSVGGQDGTVVLDLPNEAQSCRLVVTGLQDMPGGLSSLLAVTVS